MWTNLAGRPSSLWYWDSSRSFPLYLFLFFKRIILFYRVRSVTEVHYWRGGAKTEVELTLTFSCVLPSQGQWSLWVSSPFCAQFSSCLASLSTCTPLLHVSGSSFTTFELFFRKLHPLYHVSSKLQRSGLGRQIPWLLPRESNGRKYGVKDSS